ncbi:hypothetical protein GGS24DRAFT_512303 [Hypoxylon argillaceum]|nr:hypothetical protein GGS24DRAFT_512303 [Hypoxylon argillaceum]
MSQLSLYRDTPLSPAVSALSLFSPTLQTSLPSADLALAADYYVRDGCREYHPEPVELPDFNRMKGVGFDTQVERTAPTRLEPLATVYCDSSIEWGMVVVDINKLDVVRIMDELRPRKAMFAAKYMVKFDYEASVYGNAAECLAQIPLVNSASMNLVWPPSAEDDMNPSLALTCRHEVDSGDSLPKRL